MFPALCGPVSHVNAEFKGNHTKEYAWFSMGAATPLFAIGADRAARSIVRATERGDSEKILSLPAHLLARFHGLMPELTGPILSLVNRLILPESPTKATDTRKGTAAPEQLHSRIPLPIENTEPMDNMAPGVAGLRTIMVNLYGVASSDRSWVLIDGGLPFQSAPIRNWAHLHFGETPPQCILLTHGHFDHIGSLQDLAKTWDVPVYAHTLELPYLTGRSKYPPPDPFVGGGSMALLSGLSPRGPIELGDRARALPADGVVPGLSGWRWIHTPGHTAGHVSFFRDDDRVLIAGDAFVTTKRESLTAIIQQRPELHGPPSYYTSDWEAARLSVQRLADLEPVAFACGHGRPMIGPAAADALHHLADHFDEIARPLRGRYVRRPAVTDERGIVSLPPPVVGPVPKLLIGAAVGGAVWYTVSRLKNRPGEPA